MTDVGINIPLENVKNMRDMSTASACIAPARIIRTGCVSKATTGDIATIKEMFDFKSYVDLRSPAEIEEDEHMDSAVYSGFSDYTYDSKAGQFALASETTSVTGRRYFMSLMSESLIKKGVFFRLQKRNRAKAIGLYLLSAFSRRANKNVRSMFLDRINKGGLRLLNELVVDTSGADLVKVLKIVADPTNHPVAMYCTAGKDRTGLLAMLILSVVGASEEEIVADYVLSDSAYKDIGDSKAMVAALKQTDVDPETFLRAKPEVMHATMQYVREKHGSVDGFLDQHGFSQEWRERLRTALVRPVSVASA